MNIDFRRTEFPSGINLSVLEDDVRKAPLRGEVLSIDITTTHVHFIGNDTLDNLSDRNALRDVVESHDGTPDPDSALNNLTATTDPTTDDNLSAGYSKGSIWINTVLDKALILVDAAAGLWKETTNDFLPPALTQGSVLFAEIDGSISENNANLFWDDAKKSLGIGTNLPDSKSILDLKSTTKGFLPPRMTTAQIDAISAPATGLVVFDTDKDLLRIRKTAEWCHVPCGVVTGQFSHSVAQKPSVTTPISLNFNTNDITLDGISHSTAVKNEEFTAMIGKPFTFMLAPQWERTSGSAVETIDFFIQKSTDGGTVFVDVANSNVKVRLSDSIPDASNVIPLMATIAMNKDDIVRFQMRVSKTGNGLGTIATAAETGPPTIPATPAQILTIFSGD